jgi:hypothetical protein
MPFLTPEMQVFTRDVRRMLRHAWVQRMYSSRFAETLKFMSVLTAFRFNHRGENAPRFLMRKLSLTVGRLMCSIDTGAFGLSVKYMGGFVEQLTHANLVLTGTFHKSCAAYGECAICLSRGSGRWWKSLSCGHCFHVQCISTHFNYDNRCPLCRVEI